MVFCRSASVYLIKSLPKIKGKARAGIKAYDIAGVDMRMLLPLVRAALVNLFSPIGEGF